MLLNPAGRRHRFERISTPSGGFSMIAMDQRESLRTMFQDSTGGRVPDATLADFKLAVAETLSPHASALLLDEQYGLEAMRALHPRCGLIVAADRLTQPPGGPVVDTALDTDLDVERARAAGAVALKLLVIWRPDGDASARTSLVQRFLDLCRHAALLGIVEGVVRPQIRGEERGWDREEAIVACARELGALRPDLYKAEVPLHGNGDRGELARHCRMLSDTLPCPWVVLSSGVAARDFPAAVETACRAGASGFLAGRGIWMDLVGPGDYRARLADVAVRRLTALTVIVERVARPWWDVAVAARE